ncbi:hypothetical protein N656DRAFT_778125 [Canariomyces notabilis]|uniref:Uncharacterized protein n=1 Tax=Canariomyces notabilis TaxID=2074819 RepID=A0AAN6TF99_9PEZI|nr:hypothetical protein N656DRAFT_778125 [Canariomyces arenarius]
MRPLCAISIALAWQNALAIGPFSFASAALNYTGPGWRAFGGSTMEMAGEGVSWAKEKAGEGVSWAGKNPVSTAFTAISAGGLAASIAPAIATSPMYALAGIASKGPVAG